MKTSIMVGGATHTDMQSMVEFVQHAERLGVDYAWSAEGWSQDAVTSLAYLAGQTKRIILGTGHYAGISFARAPVGGIELLT